MAFSLRPILPDDFPALYALDQACFPPGIAWSKAELKYFLKYPGNIGVVAEDNAQHIAGFAIAGKQMRKGAVLGRLITIDVEASQRRRGVGHILLEEIERQLSRPYRRSGDGKAALRAVCGALRRRRVSARLQ